MLDKLQKELDTKNRVLRLLAQVEDCISFVVSTGNSSVASVDASMSLDSYVCDILLVSRDYWSEISCPCISLNVQLKHLRCVLQFLENMIHGDPLDMVVLKYRESFDGIVTNESLSEVSKANDFSKLQPLFLDLLVEQLCRDNWPRDACLKDFIGYRDEDVFELESFRLFPEVLCLCHAFSVYKYLTKT